jgi:hypothetical protein
MPAPPPAWPMVGAGELLPLMTRGLFRGPFEPPISCGIDSGRGERIRTSDLLVPNTPEGEPDPTPPHLTCCDDETDG